eukprot:gnl/TRDRNA2_/TRDRNA2_146967_c1_seq1.p1 gnl/TRDRNA2_/TRDRNA2_146967_c1~~gnl/TRDRNA2_/TRDRNA2_146967_c1_seq1.p1  ORF type:complete len:125 (+),score=16.72 gnl/TRDRNA2_/TRDRNA2_146967_c1_seq1:267-641(+)
MVGFDNFEGLPDEEGAPAFVHYPPGAYNSGDVHALMASSSGLLHIRSMKGFLNESLKLDLVEKHQLKQGLCIDIDVDLYISALQAFDFVFVAGIAVPGALIGYDEWRQVIYGLNLTCMSAAGEP